MALIIVKQRSSKFIVSRSKTFSQLITDHNCLKYSKSSIIFVTKMFSDQNLTIIIQFLMQIIVRDYSFYIISQDLWILILLYILSSPREISYIVY